MGTTSSWKRTNGQSRAVRTGDAEDVPEMLRTDMAVWVHAASADAIFQALATLPQDFVCAALTGAVWSLMRGRACAGSWPMTWARAFQSQLRISKNGFAGAKLTGRRCKNAIRALRQTWTQTQIQTKTQVDADADTG